MDYQVVDIPEKTRQALGKWGGIRKLLCELPEGKAVSIPIPETANYERFRVKVQQAIRSGKSPVRVKTTLSEDKKTLFVWVPK